MIRIAAAGSLVALVFLLGCRVQGRSEGYCQWHKLSPPPTDSQIAEFRRAFPATAVTTTQPGSWDKIEVGMTRGMVRALAGGRLVDGEPGMPAILEQVAPQHFSWHVRLYFTPSPSDRPGSSENDILKAIFVRSEWNRPIRSTDWP